MGNFLELKQTVLKSRKTLAKIYKNFGNATVANYVAKWQVGLGNERTQVFNDILQNQLAKNYPKAIVKTAVEQMRGRPLVSTIDHHGLLSHPFFINSNLIFSLSGQKLLICLSTAGISLNNSSWPAAMLIHSDNGRLKKFSFFPDNLKNKTVFAAPPIKKSNEANILNQLIKDAELSQEQKRKLTALIKEIFSDDIFEQKNFSVQASLLSTKLWAKIFPSAPSIVYVPLEELVVQALIDVVTPQTEGCLHRLIFTESGWRLLEKYFTGMQGAFGQDSKGSFLFWAVDGQGKRAQLRRDGLKIKASEFIDYDLTPKALLPALKSKQLYPTSLLCFLVLLYFGISCVGGFNQINWLSDVKKKFMDLLEEMGESEIGLSVSITPTENFAEGNLAFLFNNQQLIKATGLDLYLTGQDYYQKYIELSKVLTVGESIDSLLPEIYRVIAPSQNRKAELAAMTDEQIIQTGSMGKKLKKILDSLT